MKVGIVVNGYPSALRFKSKVIYSEPQDCFSDTDKQYIDDFEEQKVNDAKFLGEGVTARAFYSPLRNFVIKQNKINPYIKDKERFEMGSLAYENKILGAIGDDVKTTQRAVGYAETEAGGKFLVSTFVQGKPSDYYTNPFKPKHIDRLLRNLNRLDRSQIINPDLSHPNLLLTDDYNVNIIDYQWAEIFNFGSYKYGLKNSFFPEFEAPNNAVMFESAALSGYLRSMPKSEVKEFVRNYLLTKAKYTEKKVKYLEKLRLEYPSYITKEMIDFEKAKYQAYLNPTNDVINAEILKFNMLNLHRRQYGCHDENVREQRNVIKTIPLCVEAWDCANNLANFKPKEDSQNNTYFEFMNRYGKFWQDNMKNCYPATFRWVYNLVSKNINDDTKIYFPEKIEDFSGLDIISCECNNEPDSSDSIETNTKEKEAELRKIYLDAAENGYDYYRYLKIYELIRTLS